MLCFLFSCFFPIHRTFDPPHNEHIEIAIAALESKLIDHVLLLPTSANPLKTTGSPNATGEQRLKMCALAIAAAGLKHISLCDREVRANKYPCYTIDTVRELLREDALLGRHRRYCLMIGEDTYRYFHKWKEPQQLIKLTGPLIVFHRGRKFSNSAPLSSSSSSSTLSLSIPSFSSASFTSSCASPSLPSSHSPVPWTGLSINRLEYLYHDVSSTIIRHRIKNNQPWRHLVAHPVASFIDEHRLYLPPLASASSGSSAASHVADPNKSKHAQEKSLKALQSSL